MIRYITEILPEIFLNTTEKGAAKLDWPTGNTFPVPYIGYCLQIISPL